MFVTTTCLKQLEDTRSSRLMGGKTILSVRGMGGWVARISVQPSDECHKACCCRHHGTRHHGTELQALSKRRVFKLRGFLQILVTDSSCSHLN